jgi:hypothetical protein
VRGLELESAIEREGEVDGVFGLGALGLGHMGWRIGRALASGMEWAADSCFMAAMGVCGID